MRNEQVAEDLISEVSLDGRRQAGKLSGFPKNTVKKLADLLKAAGMERGWP